MGNTYGTCVLQVPMEQAKYIIGYIDRTIAPMTDREKKEFTPSRCYLTHTECVFVWRDICYQGKFWEDLLRLVYEDKNIPDAYHRVYSLDEKEEGKVFRCIPEVPNALCVQYWKVKEMMPVILSQKPEA